MPDLMSAFARINNIADRAKAGEPISVDELRSALNDLRAGRFNAASAAKASKKKSAKINLSPEEQQKLLDDLLGME